jgi:hypothetical protein
MRVREEAEGAGFQSAIPRARARASFLRRASITNLGSMRLARKSLHSVRCRLLSPLPWQSPRSVRDVIESVTLRARGSARPQAAGRDAMLRPRDRLFRKAANVPAIAGRVWLRATAPAEAGPELDLVTRAACRRDTRRHVIHAWTVRASGGDGLSAQKRSTRARGSRLKPASVRWNQDQDAWTC